MSKLFLKWQAIHDQRTCKICMALDGYTWEFQTGVNAFPKELIHPTYGVVWNTSLGSEAHGKHNNTCRCTIHSEFDFADLKADIEKLYENLKAEASQ